VDVKRRDLLTGALGVGLGAAVSEVLSRPGETLSTVEHTDALRKVRVPDDSRIIVCVLGYRFAGDGGGKIMYWDPWSQLAENKGTVIASDSQDKGRWRQLHQGELDFRQFGIFSGEHPADDALESMINDPEVFSIRAYTGLNFTRRHTFTRSGITLDFGSQTVTATGIEKAAPEAPYLSAILLFNGTITGDTMSIPLRESVPELSDIYPVGNSRDFVIGGWYRLESGRRKGRAERIIQRLIQVTEYCGDNHIRVNYKTGYALPSGDTLHWTPVSPVENIHVINMVFDGTGAFADNGIHPLALEYAVNCNVRNIHAVGTFWPVIFRRWNTGYRTEQCSLNNPPTTTYGGAGYLTQQIYCLYGHISDCTTANARHLNDFTASSYCQVENCHATGDQEGGFTTHGQYEHDLVYLGNSGILSLANSGRLWGQSARRIRVERHACTMLIADTFTSDLTLTDVHICRTSFPDGPGILRANTDGLQMRGCQIDGEMTLVSYTRDSLRRNLIEGCGIRLDSRHDLTISDLDDSDPYIGSHPPAVWRNTVNGPGELTFTHCHIEGDGPEASWWLGGESVHFSGCHFKGISLHLKGTLPQRVVFTGGNVLTGPGKPQPLLTREGEHRVTWKISDLYSHTDISGGSHINIASGENLVVIRSSEFSGGQCLFTDNAFRQGSRLTAENNLYLAGCRVIWPAGQATKNSPGDGPGA